MKNNQNKKTSELECHCISTEAEQRACEWIVYLESDDVTNADRQQFERWLEVDNQHKIAYQQVLSIWQGAAMLNTIETSFVPNKPKSSFKLIISSKYTLVFFSVVFLIMVSVFSSFFNLLDTDIYKTQEGELSHLELSDGSTVILSPDSHIEVSYSNNHRYIKFYTGSAIFDVVKNPLRPFIIETNYIQMTVRAGPNNNVTYNMKSDEYVNNTISDVSVKVDEGKVQVVQIGFDHVEVRSKNNHSLIIHLVSHNF